jgi:hypothetical protein
MENKKPVIADENDYNDAEVKVLESEILANEKKCVYPNLGTIIIKNPTLREQADINSFYAKMYTSLLKEGDFLSTKQMEELLEKNGTWTDQDDSRLDELRQSMVNKKIQLLQIREKKRLTAEDKKNIEQLSSDYNKQEIEFYKKSVYKYSLFDNTLERRAENETLYYKILKCVYKADGSHIWNSLDEMLSSSFTKDFEMLTYDCISFWRGPDLPLFENYQTPKAGNENIEQV